MALRLNNSLDLDFLFNYRYCNQGNNMRLLIWTLILASFNLHANEDGLRVLINSISVCPTENNPLTILHKSKGNSFTSVEIENEDPFNTVIIAEMVHDPRLINPMTRAPMIRLGSVKIAMIYAEEEKLVCKLKYSLF